MSSNRLSLELNISMPHGRVFIIYTRGELSDGSFNILFIFYISFRCIYFIKLFVDR